MKTKTSAKKKSTASRTAKAVGSGPHGSHLIPASKLLRAEAARLDVLRHAMPDKAQGLMSGQVWSFNMAAAFLDCLGAPEKLERYVPANTKSSEPASMASARRTGEDAGSL